MGATSGTGESLLASATSSIISHFFSHFLLQDGTPSPPSIATSSFLAVLGVGLGCEANSRSFAESRAVRSVSTGPKTRLFNFELFAFMVLALDPFAIVNDFLCVDLNGES